MHGRHVYREVADLGEMLGGFRAVMVAGTHEADDNFACRRKGKQTQKVQMHSVEYGDGDRGNCCSANLLHLTGYQHRHGPAS